jgi:uncharacterized membrane protein
MNSQSSSKKKRQLKKDLVLGKSPKRKVNPFLLITAAMVIAAAISAAYFVWTAPVRPTASAPRDTNAPIVGVTQVRYPLALFEGGQAHHFEYPHDGLTIRYFVLKSADGVVRAAFDACDVCWRSGKGYTQDGDEMVCKNCGRRFASNRINDVQGGCNPAPLNRIVEGDHLIIQAEDIVRGRAYFDFNKET